MKTSTRIVLPFFHALMEAYAYNSENDSEEHRKRNKRVPNATITQIKFWKLFLRILQGG